MRMAPSKIINKKVVEIDFPFICWANSELLESHITVLTYSYLWGRGGVFSVDKDREGCQKKYNLLHYVY